MNPRALWASAQRWYATHSSRDRRILGGVGFAIVASLLYLGVVDPVLAYRKHVAEETTEGLEVLERSARFLNAADSLRTERDQLQKRLEEAKSRLLPGDSGTLGAAALQERANAIAAAKGITVQSTQVMREEVADPFRKVSVRLTVSGELKPFADFISSLEYGPQQLNLPFVEISRRGAVAGQKGPRTLSATVEVNGYLRGAQEKDGKEGKDGKSDETPPAEGEAAPAAEGEATPPAGEGDAATAKPPGEADGAAKPSPEAGGTAPRPAPDGAPAAAVAPSPEAAVPPAAPSPTPAPGAAVVPPAVVPPASAPVAPPAAAAPPGRGEATLPLGAQADAPPPAPPAAAPATPPAAPPVAPAVPSPAPAPPAAAAPAPPVAAAPVVPIPAKGFD